MKSEEYIHVNDNIFMKLILEIDNFVKLNELLNKKYNNIFLKNITKADEKQYIKCKFAINKLKTIYIKLSIKENFKRMKQKIRIEYFNIFSNKLFNKLSFFNRLKHHIIFKNEKKIIKKRMI